MLARPNTMHSSVTGEMRATERLLPYLVPTYNLHSDSQLLPWVSTSEYTHVHHRHQCQMQNTPGE